MKFLGYQTTDDLVGMRLVSPMLGWMEYLHADMKLSFVLLNANCFEHASDLPMDHLGNHFFLKEDSIGSVDILYGQDDNSWIGCWSTVVSIDSVMHLLYTAWGEYCEDLKGNRNYRPHTLHSNHGSCRRYVRFYIKEN